MRLTTNYAVTDVPHDEHPMPQLQRKHWLCLNGKWELKKENENGETLFSGEVLVPFSPESILSGVDEGFVLGRGEKLVYRRGFPLFREMLQETVLLHFSAVDSECDVYVNRELVGRHKGGYTAFTVDISKVAREGYNEVVVECRDEAMVNGGARGKQSVERGGIWYTAQSGIWQTVWVESMPKTYISDLRIYPDAINKQVRICSKSGGEEQFIVVTDGAKEIFRSTYLDEITLSYDFELWTPEHPKLYEMTITNRSGDEVRSYFGVRTFGKTRDKNGKMRLTLNGKPYFFNGVLDQGYWADGLMTYPSDKAAYDELKMLKEMGFNTVRKHCKLEPMRWYYHCDRLGLVVWQDFVNGGGAYKFSHVAALPFLGFMHRDSDYRYFSRENEGGRVAFMRMADEIIAQLFNTVSVGVWTLFNEGWGQFDSAQMTEYVRGKDGSRLIDSASGWHDQGVGKTELRSLHTYYTPLRVPKDVRPVVLSEFGGYSQKIEGHVFDSEKEFGYKKFDSTEALCEAVQTLFLKKLKPLIKKGLSGSIYTQVSDVEEEVNGLVTYDRKVIKIPVAFMRKINEQIREESEKIE